MSNGITFVVSHVSVMVLFANVADPLIGGTYVTLLTTVYNIGNAIPNTLGLYLISFTPQYCSFENYKPSHNMTVFEHKNVTEYLRNIETNRCSTKLDKEVN
jgi:hypothetical protein